MGQLDKDQPFETVIRLSALGLLPIYLRVL